LRDVAIGWIAKRQILGHPVYTSARTVEQIANETGIRAAIRKEIHLPARKKVVPFLPRV
jgi:hypothetical protein